MKSIAVKPRLSEKTYALSEERNTYVFEVPIGTNKHTVKAAVTSQFGVSVTNVRIASIPGKNKRVYRKRGRSVHTSVRSGLRKAFVTLADGDKLPIFADSSSEEPKKSDKEKK